VLVLQKGCHFCSDSAPFYQRLARAASGRDDLQLVAALPQSEAEARQYLNDLQVPLGEVRQTALASIGVRGTPTLLLVDKTGTITDEWVGRLSPDKESEVLGRLRMKL
jgi:thioredoxin-related protein